MKYFLRVFYVAFTSCVIFTHLTICELRIKNVDGIRRIFEDDNFCERLPHSDYLSETDLSRACAHRRAWLRAGAFLSSAATLTEKQRRYMDISGLNAPLLRGRRDIDAMNKLDLELVDSTESSSRSDGDQIARYLDGKGGADIADLSITSTLSPVKKVIRKEYRMMTNTERAKLTAAMNALKRKTIDNITVWDLHTVIHYPDSAVGAHWGPAFLPWHREFLRRLELALQNEVLGVSLPYWDSTLDYGLPDPSDSVLWTDELLGNGNGYVKTGPFRDWFTNVLMPLSPVPVQKLFRSTGARNQDRLLSPQDVEWILNRQNYSELTFCHDKTFESMHGLSHVWVGGFMYVIRVSPNDPVFYMHHAFIDYIWERFRQTQQNRYERENSYARKICDRKHGFNAQMAPFHLKNRDGMSNDYTDRWYEYQPVVNCNPERPFCDSHFLFCDVREWRCRSRIQLGGNCTGFAGTEICYNSMCIQKVCRIPATAGNGFERREFGLAPARAAFGRLADAGILWTKTLLLGDDHRPVGSGIAHVTVHVAGRTEDGTIVNGNVTAFTQRTIQYPEIAGIIYVPLPQLSFRDAANITLEARDHYGRYCQSYCFNGTNDAYEVKDCFSCIVKNLQVCEPHINLQIADDQPLSNLSYTHSFGGQRFLDMDMSVHFSYWRVYTPFMVFACHRKLIDSSAMKENAALLSLPLERSTYVWFRVTVLRRVDSHIDLENMQIESEDLDDQTDVWINAIKSARSAYDQSVVFVRARNPRLRPDGGTRVRVAVREAGIRIDCDIKCNPIGFTNSTRECDSIAVLHTVADRSQEQIFAGDPAFLPLLGWRMVGHPNEWRLQTPYLSFYC